MTAPGGPPAAKFAADLKILLCSIFNCFYYRGSQGGSAVRDLSVTDTASERDGYHYGQRRPKATGAVRFGGGADCLGDRASDPWRYAPQASGFGPHRGYEGGVSAKESLRRSGGLLDTGRSHRAAAGGFQKRACNIGQPAKGRAAGGTATEGRAPFRRLSG